MKLKTIYNNDIRLWKNAILRMKPLREFVVASFTIRDEFLITYEDEEGDKVTLVDDMDLGYAVKFAASEGRKSLKLYVSLKNTELNQTPLSSPTTNSVGITYTGAEKNIATGGSADNEGAKAGWKNSQIDENSFNSHPSRPVANSGDAFNVQFRTKNENQMNSRSPQIQTQLDSNSIPKSSVAVSRNSKLDALAEAALGLGALKGTNFKNETNTANTRINIEPTTRKRHRLAEKEVAHKRQKRSHQAEKVKKKRKPQKIKGNMSKRVWGTEYIALEDDTPVIICNHFGLDMSVFLTNNRIRFPEIKRHSKFIQGTSLCIKKEIDLNNHKPKQQVDKCDYCTPDKPVKPPGTMLMCESCQKWYHVQCVGLGGEDLEVLVWSCKKCIQNHTQLIPNRAQV